MKKLILLFLLVALMLSPLPSFADSGELYDVVLQEQPSSDPDEDSEEIFEIPDVGRRMPARRVMCEISRENGVSIARSGVSGSIVSYEVYEPAGGCVAVFADEQDFIDFIFSGISGEYLLRFRTPEHTYSGIISIK